MASIRQRGDSYQISVYVGRDVVTNKRKFYRETYKPTETSPSKIEKEVKRYALNLEEKIKNGDFVSGEKMTFSELVELWKRDYASNSDNLRTSTFENYEDNIKINALDYLGNMKVNKIRTAHLNTIYADMKQEGKSLEAIKKTHASIRSVFNRAVKWEIISRNPCDNVEMPKEKKKEIAIKSFTPEQASAFLEFIPKDYTVDFRESKRNVNGKDYKVVPYQETLKDNTQWEVYFNLAIYGGFRRGELIALTWEDIDFENNKISISKAVSKTKKFGLLVGAPKNERSFRVVAMPESTMNLLMQWKNEQKRLSLKLGSKWQGKTGRDFDKNNIFIQIDSGLMMHVDSPTSKFKKLVKRYNENHEEQLPKISLHGLRHTNVSILFASGIDIVTISARLGHSPEVALKIYAHLLPNNEERAVEVLVNALAV